LVVWRVREILLGGLVAIDHKSQVCARIDLIVRDDVEEVNSGTSEGDVRIERTVRRNPEIVMPGVVKALSGIGFLTSRQRNLALRSSQVNPPLLGCR